MYTLGSGMRALPVPVRYRPRQTGGTKIMTHETRHRFTSDVQDQDEDGYDDHWPPRLPSSSRRYVQPTTTTTQYGTTRYALHPGQVQRLPIPARRSALPPSAQRLTEEPPAAFPRRKRRSG